MLRRFPSVWRPRYAGPVLPMWKVIDLVSLFLTFLFRKAFGGQHFGKQIMQSINSSMRNRIIFFTGAILVSAIAYVSHAAAGRTEQQIIADLNAVVIPNYSFGDQIDARYRDQMKREL